MANLTYEILRDAVARSGVGIRARTILEPLGGPGDKVFPPTYGLAAEAKTKYAIEQRKVNGETRTAVVLDSVASQANRMELALLEAVRSGGAEVPLISVDFSEVEGLQDLDKISSLEAPHRVFDAIFRDSLLDDKLFRLSDVGMAIVKANIKSAAAMFRYSPTTLLFGGWDSTGPKGGLGAKYERALTSEIVATGIELGSRTSSRIDPLGIELKAGPVYEAAEGTWTLNPSEAVKEKGKPKLYRRAEISGRNESGRPANLIHGNIPPKIVTSSGGVTVDEVTAITVLSFIQLRRLRFPIDGSSQPLSGDGRKKAETDARAALAALGLAAITLAFEAGFDLRSRCVLVPSAGIQFELLRSGVPSTEFSLGGDEALKILGEARRAAADSGLAWETEEILLKPAEKLIDLIRRSRKIRAAADQPAGGIEED